MKSRLGKVTAKNCLICGELYSTHNRNTKYCNECFFEHSVKSMARWLNRKIEIAEEYKQQKDEIITQQIKEFIDDGERTLEAWFVPFEGGVEEDKRFPQSKEKTIWEEDGPSSEEIAIIRRLEKYEVINHIDDYLNKTTT